MHKLSLRTRLLLFFMIIAMVVWLLASGLAWWQTRHTIDEMFDTQQMLFAKRLATANLGELSAANERTLQPLPKTQSLMPKGDRGSLDDDALGFSIFNNQGELLLSDNDHGNDFGYSTHTGFVNKYLENDDDDRWRILYIHTLDKRYTIAVGQEQGYREDLVMSIVVGQLYPWLLALPVMLALIAWITRHELMPLREVAREVKQRNPDERTSLQTKHIPQEARPLVEALNTLFQRISEMLERERQFTADAAHELRTPLTALRIQSEVAILSQQNSEVQQNALKKMVTGIDRTSRLVDQLLALSRLDGAASQLGERTFINWQKLVEQVTQEVAIRAETKSIDVQIRMVSPPAVVEGNEVLLNMLVNNLVNNALRYTPQSGKVQIVLHHRRLHVIDNGPGVMPGHLAKLGERFFRPPGLKESGSGLGLSIVRRIARLHNYDVTWHNIAEGGFEVVLTFVKEETNKLA